MHLRVLAGSSTNDLAVVTFTKLPVVISIALSEITEIAQRESPVVVLT
jgi:hypothetical protein